MKITEIRAGLDSSVVVRLLTGDPVELSQTAYDYVSETQALGKRLLVSNLVISEVYFACQHHYKMPKHSVLQGIHKLLSEPVFLTDRVVLTLLGSKGMDKMKPGFIDRIIHSEYSESNIPLATFEKSAKHLENVEILTSGKK